MGLIGTEVRPNAFQFGIRRRATEGLNEGTATGVSLDIFIRDVGCTARRQFKGNSYCKAAR